MLRTSSQRPAGGSRRHPREAGHDELHPVPREKSGDSLDRVRHAGKERLDQDGLEVLEVPVEDRQQDVFLGLEEVVDAARMDARVLSDVLKTGLAVSDAPEELARRLDNFVAARRFGWFHQLVTQLIE